MWLFFIERKGQTKKEKKGDGWWSYDVNTLVGAEQQSMTIKRQRKKRERPAAEYELLKRTQVGVCSSRLSSPARYSQAMDRWYGGKKIGRTQIRNDVWNKSTVRLSDEIVTSKGDKKQKRKARTEERGGEEWLAREGLIKKENGGRWEEIYTVARARSRDEVHCRFSEGHRCGGGEAAEMTWRVFQEARADWMFDKRHRTARSASDLSERREAAARWRVMMACYRRRGNRRKVRWTL